MLFNLILLATASRPLLDLSEGSDFRDWIRKLNITIDDIPIVDNKNDVEIRDLRIFNIDLDDIRAEFYPNPQIVEDAIVIKASVQADIDGKVDIRKAAGIKFDQHAKITADAKQVNIELGFEFIKSENGLIESVRVVDNECKIAIGTLDLNITGLSTVLQWIVDLLKGLIVSTLKNKIGEMVCSNIKDVLGDQITKAFAKANQIIIPYLNNTDPINIPIAPGMRDMNAALLVDVLRYVTSVFVGIDGPLNLNALINRFTKGSGEVRLSTLMNYFGKPLPLEFNMDLSSLNASVNMTINDVNLTGLNTWGDFTFFDPISTHILDTHTSLQNLGINVSFGVNVSADGEIISTGDTYLSEQGDIDLFVENNTMDLQIQVASPEGVGKDYTNNMCLNPDCIISLISPNGTGVTKLGFDTNISYVSIEASTQAMELEIRNFINSIVKLFVDNYRPIIPKLINGVVNTYGLKAVNEVLNNTLNNASCAYLEDDPYNDFVGWTTYTAIGASCAVILFIYILMVISDKIREKRLSINSTLLYSLSVSQDAAQNNQDVAHVGCFASFFRTDSEASLLMNPKLPLFVRLLMPLLLALNITLFVSSNTGIGASVFVKFTLGDKLIALPSMFDFGLINSIRDMYQAKAYFLAGLIAVMSCGWPYLKLVLMIVAWIMPTSIIRKKHREEILRILDALGKWSLVDSFVMILMLVAFHFGISFPTVSEEIKEPLTFFLYVFPAYGFVTLMLGTVVSLMLSHIILAIDRYVDSSFNEDEGGPEEKVALMNFCKRKYLRPIAIIILCGTLFTLGCGLYFKSFSFDFVGLAGWAMTLLNEEHMNEYSVIELGVKVPDCAEFPNSFGVRFTQVLYIVVTIAVPILHVFCLLSLWVVPMTRKAQVGLYKACEVMYAWSCLDVFVVSVLAAVMEISQFARFMVGDRCDAIDPIVKMFFADEELIRDHETCFDVITVLLPGSWLLFAAAICHDIATIIINKVAGNALEERASALASANSSKTYLSTKAMISTIDSFGL